MRARVNWFAAALREPGPRAGRPTLTCMWDSKCQVATWRAAARARAADGLQFEAVPAFEQQDLLVDPGQRAGGHEQVAQVRGGPPARQVVQRIVGQRDVPAGQAAQVLGRRGVVAEPVIAVAGLRVADAALCRMSPAAIPTPLRS